MVYGLLRGDDTASDPLLDLFASRFGNFGAFFGDTGIFR